MAEESNAQQTPTQPVMRVLAQYIRDLSFENILAQKGIDGDLQPDINVQVALDAKKRNVDNQYEVISKYTVTAKNTPKEEALFLLELEFAGVFHVENIAEDQLHPFLMIECPRLLFPFVRRIVADMTREGGFPPLNLDMVDFVALYRQELEKRSQNVN